MASTMGKTSEKESIIVRFCTFCNNSTNGFDKWLYVREQAKSPFFPILGKIRGQETVYDDSGKALVCIACFHHLLRQWSSFDRRRVPLQKREYTLIAEEKLSNFQVRREEEIRKEAELKLKQIKLREDRIKKEAQDRLELHRRREQQIREEAEKRLFQEGEELEKIKEETEKRLRGEREQEEKLRWSLEEDIREEKQKGEYIRREAERLLREEKLLSSNQISPNVRTEFLIQSPQGRAYDNYSHSNQEADLNMNRSRSKKMEYDPETGCYRRIVPLDFEEQKVEDIVQNEMKKSEVKMKLRSDQPSWRRAEEKEKGSTPDSSLEDLTLSKTDGDSIPHYLSGDDIQTEYKFTTKEETTVESSPTEKNSEFEEEEIRKAGEAMKAKFDEDRKKFERDSDDVTMTERSKRSYERRRRSDDDPDSKKARDDTKERSMSLEKKIKDMEERRARMLRRSSGENVDDTVKITRTVTTETSSSAFNDDKDDSRSRRARMREERNRRRLASEGIDTKPTKSAGVKLELRGSGFGSSDVYMGGDDASDITFTEKKPSSDKKDSSEETTTTKTTKTISLSGSLLDEPNVWTPATKSDDTEIAFSAKRPTEKDNDANKQSKPSRNLVEEQEVKLDESEPVHSQFPGLDLMRDEPDDIVFTVKKTTVTNTVESTDDPGKSISKQITLEQRSLDPKTDLITWDEDVVDAGNGPIFKDAEPEKKLRTVEPELDNSDIKPVKKPRQRLNEFSDSKTDTKPVKKPRERILETTDYQGSLARAERSQERRGKEQIIIDDTDGYKGSLDRGGINRIGSFNKGRNDLPPVILHDIESDIHVEQPTLEPRRELPAERTSPEPSPIKEVVAPVPIPRYQEKSTDDERRKRQLEIEEKQRQIMEKQKRASVKRREKPESYGNEERSRPQSSDDVEDLKEKRRSLLMMWESYAEGEGPGPENKQEDQPRRTSFGYDKMMMEAVESDPSAVNSTGIAGTMDMEDENEEQRTPLVDVDEHHKLNDDELKWERAGQFQPGRLKTKFHDVEQDEPSADNIVFETKKSWKSLNNNNAEETTPNYVVEQRYNYQAPDDISYSESSELESAPKRGLWDDVEDQSTHKDDDDEEDQRKPIVDVDERNRMTEEEARWERAGHFQPGKINTSIFEGGKKTVENEREGPQKWRKSESSRYEQIKKIQRTDSKKEMLVPKKVELQASDNEDVEEQDEDEHFEIGKIDKSSLIYETMSDEERQRREREERNRREMEEIERAREEERRRREKEDREVVSTINTFEDDEFDAKVKAKSVNKIDLTRFVGFQKTEETVQEPRPVSKVLTKRTSRERVDIKNVETVESAPATAEEDLFEVKVRERAVGKLNLGSSPFIQRNTSGTKPSNKDAEDIVLQAVTLEESFPPLEGKNQDLNTSVRTVNKLDKSRFPFSADETRSEQPSKDDFMSPNVGRQTPVSDNRKINREREMREWEKSLQLEREQIEHVKNVHDKAFHIPQEEEGGSDNNTNSVEYESRNVKKLDMSLFSKFKQEKPEQAPVRKPIQKKEDRTVQSNEVVTVRTVKEVESAPQKLTPEEEYELKRRSVGKINKDWMTQMYQQESKETEQRRKETETQRVKQEQYEIDKLRSEENKRLQIDSEEVFGNEFNSVTEKPQDVKRLDNSVMSPFQKSGKSPNSLNRKKSRDEVREERKLARKESRTKMKPEEVLYVEETIPVESSPESFDSQQKGIGRLDKGRYLQMMGDDIDDKERRKKLLEEERVRRELEEMEQQREEELRRQQQDSDDERSLITETDKPQSVSKIDLSQFSQFQQKDTVVEVPRKTSMKKSPEVPRENVPEREIVQSTAVKEVESAPYSYYDDEIVVEEKPKTVGKLDFNKITQSFSNEAEEKRRRLKELEEERIRRENEERELLLQEQRHQTDDYVIKEQSVYEVQSEPTYFEDEVVEQEPPKKSVGKLDIGKIRQSFNEEAEERRRRQEELDRERRRREEEEKEILLREKQQKRKEKSVEKVQNEVIRETVTQEVHSSPADLSEDLMYEEKRKSVGKLDFEKITKSFGEEAEEKRRRLETERIQREKEEKQKLDREKKPLRKEKEQTRIIYDERNEVTEQDRNVVREVPSQSHELNDDQMYEEKRKSVGRLDFNKITKSFGEEAEEKRQRLRALEQERIRRDKEEKELLLREQRSDDDDFQPQHLQNGGTQEEKSVSKLDIDNIVHSFREEDEISRKRAIELEHERRRRDEEEKLNSRQLERERAHKSIALRQNVSHEVESSPTEDIFSVEKTPSAQQDRERKSSKSDLERKHSKSDYGRKDSTGRQSNGVERSKTTTYGDNEEDGVVTQNKKAVGKLDLQRFSQSFDQETRERERRSRELEIERLRLEREEMEGKTVNQTTPSERTDVRNDVHQEEENDGIAYSRPTPKKLDLSKFSAFGGGLRVTKDDSTVRRREKTQERQTRPKSIAGTSFKGVANGDGYQYREYSIN